MKEPSRDAAYLLSRWKQQSYDHMHIRQVNMPFGYDLLQIAIHEGYVTTYRIGVSIEGYKLTELGDYWATLLGI